MLSVRDLTDIYRLQKSVQDKEVSRMLAATLTHEMMTPLDCIGTFARRILTSKTEKEARHFADLIATSSKMLRLQMRNMLDRSLLEAGTFKLNLVPHQVSRVVSEVVEMLRPQALSKQVHIVFSQPEGAAI